MAKNHLPNPDDLISGDENADDKLPPRTSRPTPALSALTGKGRGLPVTTELKNRAVEAERLLEEERTEYESRIRDMTRELEEARQKEGKSAPLTLTMPVSQTRIEFRLQEIDPDLVDVSVENDRLQDLLDPVSLSDILPSIRDKGQQKPGLVRPKAGGRFELVEGSRRRATAKLLDRKFIALVGAVPDEDVRHLSLIENKRQDVSPYEKARAYQRMIDLGRYESWRELATGEGLSKGTVHRLKSFLNLDEIVIRVFPTPSDVKITYAEELIRLREREGERAFLGKVKALRDERLEAVKNGTPYLSEADVMKALRKPAAPAPKPTRKKPVIYKGSNTGVQVKRSVSSSGTTKLELAGIDEARIEKVVKLVCEELGVE